MRTVAQDADAIGESSFDAHARPAALAGRRRFGCADHRVGAQPGGQRDRMPERAHRLARERRIADYIHTPARMTLSRVSAWGSAATAGTRPAGTMHADRAPRS